MTDSSIPDVPAFADALTPLERAKLGLQDELSVFEIGLLTYPGDGDQERRRGLAERLLDAIKAGQLVADGDPDGRRTTVQFFPGHEAQIQGPFSFARRHRGTRLTPQGRVRFVEGRCGIVRVEEQDWHGDNCLVTWMDYRAFLATPAARGIPKPDWRACPRLENTVPCKDAKARLNASDADLCAWTLNRSLTAYQESGDRLERFEWPNANLGNEPPPPWRDQLAVLRFSRAELERFRPDSELRYLTFEEAIDRVQRAFPGTTREAIGERLLLKARPGKDQINYNLVAISPRPISELNRETLCGCVFRVGQIDRFAQECGEDQSAASPSETMDPDETARLPLWARARCGDELEISDIVELEFPVPPPREADREDWRRLIELAVLHEEIPWRLEVADNGYLPGATFISRRDYLAWRNLQSDPPARSRIRIWQAPAPVEFFATEAISNQQPIVESPEPEPDELLDRPRTRNAWPIGLTADYLDWKRLDTHPGPDSLEWQVRDGRLRVAIKAHCLRAYLVPGAPAPGRSDFDEHTGVFGRDGAPPKGSPLLLIEGYWYLDGAEAFYVLRDGESWNINWLYPPDPAELHRLWPDLFPDGEFYLDRERWKLVRREDLFWRDAPGQPATDPIEPAPFPQSEPDKPESGAAATRQVALAEAEDEALATLRNRLKREPDFEEFWRYLTESDATGTVADSTDDRIMWTGKDGRNCETAKRTMRNRLTKAKSRTPFKF